MIVVRTGSRGFSLVEVLIATTIAVMALASLAQMFVLAAAANRASRTRTLATILARDKMEALLHDGESETVSGMDFIDSRGEWLGDSLRPPGTAFVRRWSVTPVSGFLSQSRLLVVWITPGEGSIELARLVGAREGRTP
jgi:prepilin-type N-terminal cleavage/methylation domain-containing protein